MDGWPCSYGQRTQSVLRVVTVFVVTIADAKTRKWNFLLEDYPKLGELQLFFLFFFPLARAIFRSGE